MSPAHRVPMAERLRRRTTKTDSCWLWTGGVSCDYGRIRADSPSQKSLLVHRVAYELEYGPIPAGKEIDHRCHVALCVRPSHLRAVTKKQNIEHASGPQRNNTSGYLGVSRARNKWRGTVAHFGERHLTQLFDTPEQAAEAVLALRLSLFTHNDQDRRTA